MVYASNSALSRHKKWHKGGNPHHRFKCELCLYSTDSRKDFKRHGFIHSGERPYTCTLCGRGFTRNNHLKRHMLTHDANFPYMCSYCPKTFRRSDHLAHHLQKHHDNNETNVLTLPPEPVTDSEGDPGLLQKYVSQEMFSENISDHLAHHLQEHQDNNETKLFIAPSKPAVRSKNM